MSTTSSRSLRLPNQKRFTVSEVAALLSLSPTIVRRLIAEGRLACIRVSRKTRFITRESLVAFARDAGWEVQP